MLKPAVFLDRDGTLNKDVHYLSRAEDFDWIPGVLPALADLQRAGWALVVVTNQSGIAQGKLSEADLEAIHDRMAFELQQHGIQLQGIYHCPHHPTLGAAGQQPGPCPCRKPAPGMLLQACEDLGLDPKRSWMVGDSIRDLQAGEHLEIPGILVRTGKGAEQESRLKSHPELRALVAEDFAQAAEFILQRKNKRQTRP
ncbi:MAG: D-glycero-beta-D-manno-heptose 1,7-bisphosphate 7-phosphatase [Planctomycetota bacterium]|nr:D-glycero-beta-D-manno-heptose 1,7-bisphosphate 7-phosphatase [Planctomycetota bacterium]